MFEFVRNNDCFWPVELPKRQDDGSILPVRVLIKFRLFTRSELIKKRDAITAVAEQLAAARAGAAPDQVLASLRAQEAMHEDQDAEVRDRIVGWRDIVDLDGNAVPFDTDTLEWLLDDEPRFEALRKGLYEASRGAVAKN
jgi:hypothetical protein